MKLVSYRVAGVDRFGAVQGDTVSDLSQALGVPDLKSLIAATDWELAVAAARGSQAFSLSSVELLPPIPNPAKIIAVGLNYRDHVAESKRAESAFPVLFPRFADTQIGHRSPIWLPRNSTALDFEGELAVIIGKPGRHIDKASAMGHVAGYSCYNDGSLRDWQRHTDQHFPGKNFPHTGGFGPWLVTVDEVGDVDALELTTRLNGDIMQRARCETMIFKIPELISYISGFTALSAGDVIVTGTPSGVGAARNPKLFMKAGDVVEVEISRIGILVNEVVDEPR